MTTLAEAVILLIDRGTSSSFSSIDRNTATAGATLVDLALAGHIAVNGKTVTVTNPKPSGNLVMDEVLAQIAAGKSRKPSGWIAKLYWGFPNRVRDALAQQQVVTRSESKVFHVRKYSGAGAEIEVQARLRAAVDAGQTEDAWVVALAELIRVLGMHKQALPDLPPDEAKARIAAIAQPNWATEATRQAVFNNYVAVFAALLPIYVAVFTSWNVS